MTAVFKLKCFARRCTKTSPKISPTNVLQCAHTLPDSNWQMAIIDKSIPAKASTLHL